MQLCAAFCALIAVASAIGTIEEFAQTEQGRTLCNTYPDKKVEPTTTTKCGDATCDFAGKKEVCHAQIADAKPVCAALQQPCIDAYNKEKGGAAPAGGATTTKPMGAAVAGTTMGMMGAPATGNTTTGAPAMMGAPPPPPPPPPPMGMGTNGTTKPTMGTNGTASQPIGTANDKSPKGMGMGPMGATVPAGSLPGAQPGTGSKSTGGCTDTNELCCFWASAGECDKNVFWMRPNCQKACGTCGCTVENAATCKTNTANNGCSTTGSATTHTGTTTDDDDDSSSEETTSNTGSNTMHHQTTNTGGCSDVHASCEQWAKSGECDKNPFWMKPNCQKSCNWCGKTVADVPVQTLSMASTLNKQPTTGTQTTGTQTKGIQTTGTQTTGTQTTGTQTTGTQTTGTKTTGTQTTGTKTTGTQTTGTQTTGTQTHVQPTVHHEHTTGTHHHDHTTKTTGTSNDTPTHHHVHDHHTVGQQQPIGATTIDDDDDDSEEGCADTNQLCAFWASMGECTKNAAYMTDNCEKSCSHC